MSNTFVHPLVLLANAFLVNKDRESMSLEELREATTKISIAIAKYGGVVSWTREGLDSALYNWKDLLEKRGSSIFKNSNSLTEAYYVDAVINSGLKPEIVTAIQTVFKEDWREDDVLNK